MSAVASLRVALVGNPNCGKTALFNQLTGSRQTIVYDRAPDSPRRLLMPVGERGITEERAELLDRSVLPEGRRVLIRERTVDGESGDVHRRDPVHDPLREERSDAPAQQDAE